MSATVFVARDAAAGRRAPPVVRIAIVNRGEPAMRVIHAVRELNAERGLALRTVALVTDPDRDALFAREADEAVSLGPALVPGTDGHRHSPYVDMAVLEAVLQEARAQMAWVGWGFSAELPEFAELCERLGVTFVGPPAAAMRLLGNKITAKQLAEACGLPVGPWSGGPIAGLEDARLQAGGVGYPLMVKAAGGGGGRGIRVVSSSDELDEAVTVARAEAAAAFGDGTLFLERLLDHARHVEVQVVVDGAGTAWALGVRDCSVQRRHQKVIEESASPVVGTEREERLKAWATRLCTRAGYQGAATVEFLFDPESGAANFMEVNARLQVEHPVTEMTTGEDLVKLQLHLAMGGVLEGPPPAAHGHAIEARLCAEDAENCFTPAPGVVEMLRLPAGPGIRVDTGVSEGDTVAAEFDSMIAKVIAWGRDRSEALARLRRAIAETRVIIRGGTTNRAFLADLLSRPALAAGRADISWLDRSPPRIDGGSPLQAVALLLAAAEADDAELAIERAQFYASAMRGRPTVATALGRTLDLRMGDQRYRVRVCRRSRDTWVVELDGRSVAVDVHRLGAYERRIRFDGRSQRALCVPQAHGFKVEFEGVALTVARDDGGFVRAAAPAVVVSLRAKPGDSVRSGDVLAVLEAMKLEMPVTAPFPGRVGAVLVAQNVQVDTGQPLFVLAETEGDGARPEAEPRQRVHLPEPDTEHSGRSHCEHLDVLQQLMLGYDVDVTAARAALEGLNTSHQPACSPEDEAAAEEAVLESFADICALARRRPDDAEESTQSPQDHLLAYLRSHESAPAPAGFADALRRAVSHYGVCSLERTPALDDALYWIVRSHQHAEVQVPAVLSLLDRLLARRAPGEGSERLRPLLERLVAATRRQHQGVADLARQVRHERCDEPILDAAEQEVYVEVDRRLAALSRATDGERAGHVASLVECPQPLHNYLCARFAAANDALRGAMLEVMTRRYYRIRTIEQVRVEARDERLVAIATLAGRDHHEHVVTVFATDSELTAALRSLRPLIDDLPGADDVFVDAFVWSDEMIRDIDALAARTRRAVVAAAPPGRVHRVVVAMTGPGRGTGMAASQHLAFWRTGDHFREQRVYRSLHPMMAERLQLWRLRNFHIARLPSVEDVYAFHAVARQNPRDERLIAVAEVRDMTPVRDASGRVIALPHLERMLLEALSTIRSWQSHRAEEQRLQWNRVLLYVWPPFVLSAREMYDIVRRLTPDTEGLGLEKIVVRARVPDVGGTLRETVLELSNPTGAGVSLLRFETPALRPIQPLTPYRQKVVSMRRRGLVYPYEIVRLLTPPSDAATGEMPPGEFIEHDLDADGHLVPVDRPYGENTANLVVGVVRNFTWKHPEGMQRVVLLGDPSRSLGALAEPECRRIIAAIDLAARARIPLEWFTLSSGARIAMDSGTENMDWIARVLRAIVAFTQSGGEMNLVVNGINVGAQPYWNAEATMLMHTRGVLIMTPDGAMVLTGKQALDYSGGVSAEDNFGIGGYDRVMGPNGQAQYWAPDLATACAILLRHYEHTYRAPGERFPRRASTSDPVERDVRVAPHPRGAGSDFTTVGDIFSDERNPGRKKPFDMRAVMSAVIDQDRPPLERWAGMQHADVAIVWDAHLGGYPVCLIGFQSRPIKRTGFIPADGPDHWTPGTLFPQSSRKVARAVNAASDNRPLVVLANLSGFDGSPESMRRLQLEFGAEIGRAVVNFRGPIVFCVVSRYHGGAFVVFSAALSQDMEVAALEGSYASVIGGAPAAAVVFSRDVEKRTMADPRVVELAQAIDAAAGDRRVRLREEMGRLQETVRGEKLGEIAAEFDSTHTVQRAQQVGSVHHIVAPSRLRLYLVEAIERGIERVLQRDRADA